MRQVVYTLTQQTNFRNFFLPSKLKSTVEKRPPALQEWAWLSSAARVWEWDKTCGMESGGASMSHTVPLAMAAPARSFGRLAANSCYFFLCDMQEKFRPSIRYFPEIITVAQRMVSHWEGTSKSDCCKHVATQFHALCCR